MIVKKKQIKKEDGRYLVFYHFPRSADTEQTHTFEALTETMETFSPPATPVETIAEMDGSRV